MASNDPDVDGDFYLGQSLARQRVFRSYFNDSIPVNSSVSDERGYQRSFWTNSIHGWADARLEAAAGAELDELLSSLAALDADRTTSNE